MAGRHREGDMHYCHAPCRLQSWGWNKDRGTHVSVYFYCCSEHSHSKKKQYFQDKGFQFSKRSRHTQKTNNKNLHTCSLLHSLNFPYCALLFMKGCPVKHNGARVKSHHCSTRPEKQSCLQQPLLSSLTLKCSHIYIAFLPQTQTQKSKKG